jgi:putative ABC transport system substrate-binding protein
MASERADGLCVVASVILNNDRIRIIELASRHRLAAIYQWREHVDAGGLMSYGSSLGEVFRRAASQVDRIFKGANPADLPVEQPTQFELEINLKTAKALGITIPSSLLVRADHVIQ